MTQEQIDHGTKLLSLLDQAKAELILLQSVGDYVNLTDAGRMLNQVIAKIEDAIYPRNDDIEAAVLRDEGGNENATRKDN